MKRLFLSLIILYSISAAYSQSNPAFTISGKWRNVTPVWDGSDSYYASTTWERKKNYFWNTPW
jgi:hypothetical protein